MFWDFHPLVDWKTSALASKSLNRAIKLPVSIKSPSQHSTLPTHETLKWNPKQISHQRPLLFKMNQEAVIVWASSTRQAKTTIPKSAGWFLVVILKISRNPSPLSIFLLMNILRMNYYVTAGSFNWNTWNTTQVAWKVIYIFSFDFFINSMNWLL